MKDLHSHLLYGIDDGCKDIEESIKLLKEASNQGITELVVTPHYIEKSDYNCNNKDKREKLNRLVEELKKENINIKLYLGNEVFINENLLDLLRKKEISTINNSRYLLIEFPIGGMIYNTKDIIYELVINGCVPIIAHPERYHIFQKYPEHMEEYLRMGVLLQGNYKSLFGKYGKEAKKTLKYFLKKNWITFLGSDCHHEEDFKLKRLKKKLKSITKSDEVIEDLLGGNFDKVIKDEDLGIRK